MSDNGHPKPNGSNGGRDRRGRFQRGNAGGPGNPLGARVARFRQVLLDAVSDDDLRQVAKRLVDGAKDGDIAFIKELLLRLIGKPIESDLLERIEDLEAAHNIPSRSTP